MSSPEGGRDSLSPRLRRVLDAGSRAVLAVGFATSVLGALVAMGRIDDGVRLDQVMLFCVVPILAAIALGLALRLEASKRIQVGLALVSSGAAVILVEAVLVTASETRPSATSSPDVPTVRTVLAALRSSGDHAYPTVPGNMLVDLDVAFDADSGRVHPVTTAPAHSTVVLCTDPVVVTYESDRFGFNNPDSLWDRRADVTLIGDSYTHGYCVAPEDQIAAVLRGSWSTLNLGVRGAGPLFELAVLEEFALAESPRAVVWIYFEGNDQYDLAREVPRPWLGAYLRPGHSQSLGERQPVVDARYRTWLDSLVDAGFEDQGASRASIGEIVRRIPRLESVRRLARLDVPLPSRGSRMGILPEILERARDDVAGAGGQLLFVYLPAYERYQFRLGGGPWPRADVLAAVEAAGVPIVDLHPAFRATGDPQSLWTGPRGHLTPQGYHLVAEEIDEALGRLLAR